MLIGSKFRWLHVLPDQLTIKHSVPWLPPQCNLVKQLTKLKKMFWLLDNQLLIKGSYQLEELHKARYVGRGTERPYCLQEHHSLHIFTHTNPRPFKSHPFKLLRWLYYIVKAKLWPLVIDSTSVPLLPISQGRDWIFLHPNHMGGSHQQPTFILRAFQKSCY